MFKGRWLLNSILQHNGSVLIKREWLLARTWTLHTTGLPVRQGDLLHNNHSVADYSANLGDWSIRLCFVLFKGKNVPLVLSSQKPPLTHPITHCLGISSGTGDSGSVVLHSRPSVWVMAVDHGADHGADMRDDTVFFVAAVDYGADLRDDTVLFVFRLVWILVLLAGVHRKHAQNLSCLDGFVVYRASHLGIDRLT